MIRRECRGCCQDWLKANVVFKLHYVTKAELDCVKTKHRMHYAKRGRPQFSLKNSLPKPNRKRLARHNLLPTSTESEIGANAIRSCKCEVPRFIYWEPRQRQGFITFERELVNYPDTT